MYIRRRFYMSFFYDDKENELENTEEQSEKICVRCQEFEKKL